MRDIRYEELLLPKTCSICEEIIRKDVEKAVSFVATGVVAKRHYIHKKCVDYLNEALIEEHDDERA
ncbi:MAG: hypothetical protein PVI03_04035 [Candidatus Thorarchaeota archaeon]|jgi:hypothetical protein